jgi:hypothetical protein
MAYLVLFSLGMKSPLSSEQQYYIGFLTVGEMGRIFPGRDGLKR